MQTAAIWLKPWFVMQEHLHTMVGLQPADAQHLDEEDLQRLFTMARDEVYTTVVHIERVLGMTIRGRWFGHSRDIVSPMLPGPAPLLLPTPLPSPPWPDAPWLWSGITCGECNQDVVALPLPLHPLPPGANLAAPWANIRCVWCLQCGWAMGTFGLHRPSVSPRNHIHSVIMSRRLPGVIMVYGPRRSSSSSSSTAPEALVDYFNQLEVLHLGVGATLPESLPGPTVAWSPSAASSSDATDLLQQCAVGRGWYPQRFRA